MAPEVKIEDLKVNYEILSKWVIENGVHISVEPVMYPYRGAPIFEQGYKFFYKDKEFEDIRYKDAEWVYPKDKVVRKLCERFLKERVSYVEEYLRSSGSKHRHKGSTGVALVSLLGKLLKEFDEGYSYRGL